MSSDILRSRLRAQELNYTREQDKMAIKSIRDSLKESGKLEEAQRRLQETLEKESDGDVLAEVSAARMAGKFREEDLPQFAPVTIRPVRYAPSAAATDLEEFQRRVPMPKASTLQVAAGSYNDLMRGRYRYLNDFMQTMSVEPEERRPMTKRELQRLEKQLAAMRGNVSYILGSFIGGTALLCGAAAAGWYYTKATMGVKDTREYAEKMRELTPDVKDSMQQGTVGRTMKWFKDGFQTWLETSSLRDFTQSLQRNLGGMQSIGKSPEPPNKGA
mmetsp:Transcript_30375/g.63556  ORF Transcript_30375/g.63556 Transcript_30375/m.63556 type:complete len:273 (-) Transcript_30375:99-917(-)